MGARNRKMPTAAELHYFAHEAEEQDKKRPPLILIHGAGGSHLSWPPQIRRMAGERIYALDLAGHGRSEGLGKHSIDAYAEDVLAFMQAMELRAAVFAGISMGSAIALTLSLKYPKKVLALGLLGAGAKMRVASSILETAGSPNTFESAVDMVNGNCFSANAPQNLLQLSKQQLMENRPPVLLGDFLACNEFDVTGQLDKIKVPALIICGAEDRMTPVRYSEFLHGNIVNSQLQIVENSGHMVMAEQPDVVAELLRKFMDELPPRSRGRKERPIPDGETVPVQNAGSELTDRS